MSYQYIQRIFRGNVQFLCNLPLFAPEFSLKKLAYANQYEEAFRRIEQKMAGPFSKVPKGPGSSGSSA